MIAGTTSDAGKTTLVTGLCRWLSRQGVRVAPYKAQNMSNNSMVCADGAEIGRAQWIQAVAAGVEPEAAMNPVLLKPGSDRRSHVVLMGQPWGELAARDFTTRRTELAKAAYAAYDDLASRYDVVVCEGAGSPAEINLRAGAGGRRHRPRRRVRGDVRHRRAAGGGGPGADQRLRGEQVPRRRGAAPARAADAGERLRAWGSRRPAVAAGCVAGLRG